MNDIELERAWPAAEPPPGFSDRVLEHLQRGPALSAPVPRRALGRRWLTRRRLPWLALAAVVLALGSMVLGWPARPAGAGDVMAAEPRVVSLGERAVAEMSSGAHLRWSGDEVEQDRGEVTYRVVPGTRFRVQTPHGSVAALGTVFRVVVAERDAKAGGEPMKKRWAIAGGAATLGALLLVSVEQGSVRLSKGRDELVLGAGQSGSIGADGVPRVATVEPGAAAPGAAVLAPREPPPTPHEPRYMSPERRIEIRTKIVEQLRAAAARTSAAAREQASGAPGPEAASPHVSYSVADYSKAMNDLIGSDFAPLAQDCYTELLRTKPDARGDVVMDFKIISDESVGGIVDSAEIGDTSTLRDENFETCLTESFLSVHFGTLAGGGEGDIIGYPLQFGDGKVHTPAAPPRLRDRRNEGGAGDETPATADGD